MRYNNVMDDPLVKSEPASLVRSEPENRVLRFIDPTAYGEALVRGGWSVDQQMQQLIDLARQTENPGLAFKAMDKIHKLIKESLVLSGTLQNVSAKQTDGGRTVEISSTRAAVDTMRQGVANYREGAPDHAKTHIYRPPESLEEAAAREVTDPPETEPAIETEDPDPGAGEEEADATDDGEPREGASEVRCASFHRDPVPPE